ncbi:MAG: exodeoxyribonuclease VII small subunit [Culicoidibacterales bacterium]
MPKVKEKIPTYEELYTTLLTHLDKLENGNLALDESLALYEEAMKIAEQCQNHLERAQEKLQTIEKSEEK